MDREIAPRERALRVARRVAVVVVAVAAVVVAFVATVGWLRPSVKRSDIRVARVERGEVEATLQAAGTVVPRFEQVVSSPLEARVLRIDRRAGDAVRAGDALVTLDTGAAQLDAARLDERVSQKESEGAQLRSPRARRPRARVAVRPPPRRIRVRGLHGRAGVRVRKLRDGTVGR